MSFSASCCAVSKQRAVVPIQNTINQVLGGVLKNLSSQEKKKLAIARVQFKD